MTEPIDFIGSNHSVDAKKAFASSALAKRYYVAQGQFFGIDLAVHASRRYPAKGMPVFVKEV
ncbi:hypothetical protein [Pantoea sp. Cy-639]|jgi:hypothetical protein|uniref:hypothetical protein n=1 Tax=Pantoea sp. Cy-639 TaxID=2608360 RepID=UPI00141D7AE4|nr:hypothetical protein [Pantoea sp. Cy-639]NIF19641.1 hypothetical protein [Pantoea sp. Cy-639]